MSTPKHGHKPIKMRLCKNDAALERLGDFYWQTVDNGLRALVVIIPAQGQAGMSRSVWTIDHKNHCNSQWGWNGNKKRPTLTPSLHAVGIWHGFVKAGKLVEA